MNKDLYIYYVMLSVFLISVVTTVVSCSVLLLTAFDIVLIGVMVAIGIVLLSLLALVSTGLWFVGAA